MQRLARISIRQLLMLVLFVAVVFGFWRSNGEHLLLIVFAGSLAVLITSLHPAACWLIPLRRKAALALVAIGCFFASLGPATGLYTRYDPGWGTTPVAKSIYLRVYGPIGRLAAYPLTPIKRGYLSYLQAWMPPSFLVRDIGWGIKMQGQGEHLYLGLDLDG